MEGEKRGRGGRGGCRGRRGRARGRDGGKEGRRTVCLLWCALPQPPLPHFQHPPLVKVPQLCQNVPYKRGRVSRGARDRDDLLGQHPPVSQLHGGARVHLVLAWLGCGVASGVLGEEGGGAAACGAARTHVVKHPAPRFQRVADGACAWCGCRRRPLATASRGLDLQHFSPPQKSTRA